MEDGQDHGGYCLDNIYHFWDSPRPSSLAGITTTLSLDVTTIPNCATSGTNFRGTLRASSHVNWTRVQTQIEIRSLYLEQGKLVQVKLLLNYTRTSHQWAIVEREVRKEV
jgi:hypothetical protein